MTDEYAAAEVENMDNYGNVYNRHPPRGVPSSIFFTTNKTCLVMVKDENFFHTSVAISQLKCLDYAVFVAKMSKMMFTRFGGQVWLNSGQVRQFWGQETHLDCFAYSIFY